MVIRSLLICLVLGLLLSVFYGLVTRVSFKNQRGHISSLYCALIKNDPAFSKPIIFLPGIKGSLLRSNERQEWLTRSQILLDSEPLLYKLEDPDLEPIGILTRISLLPGLLEYSPYQHISATLACNPNAYFLSYDWRRNPIENAARLGELVDRVQQETGQKPSIIAHSMGGLVTHTYLKTNSEKIDRVVYVGVPFQPGVGFLPDIDQGSAIGLNKTILSKEAIFSHPSSFTLLPHAGQRLYKNQDLMNIETWKEHRLSIFRDGSVDEIAFKRILADATAFHREIDRPVTFSNHFLFVVGNCQQTHHSIETDGSFTYVSGDGRVPESSAYPVEKEQLNKEIFISCATHDQQLNDRNVLERIEAFLK